MRTALGASTESDYQPILIERCPGASNLIVVFASYEGRWDFRSALADKHAHKVFLKDTTRRWYQLGADGFDGIDQVVEFLRVTIQELGVQKVCTLGSSLGGYGSLMFGDLIEADHSIAFAPQSFLTAELRAMERDDRWRQDFLRFEPGKFGDLGKIPNVRAGERTIIVSQGVPIDMVHALHLSGSQNTRILAMEAGSHNPALLMKYRGTLDKILSDLVFEEEPSDSSFADFVVPEISLRQEIDNSLVEIVSDIMSQLHRSKSFEIWKVLQALCLRNDWAYGHNLMGKYYRDLSEFSKASSHFDQAIALRPEFDDALFERSMLHIRDREFDAAVLLLQIARRNDPYRAAIRARLGQAFLGLKKPAEAISQLERAVALAENWDLPRKLLSEAYLLLN